MEKDNLIRTFICIDFPDEVIKEVTRIQQIIEKQNFTGKLTELENLHLTLKFLGQVSPEKLNKTKEKLSQIKFLRGALRLSEVGTFKFRRKPKIVWIKIRGDIFDLQKQLDKSLSDLFPEEDRFMSHLTVYTNECSN